MNRRLLKCDHVTVATNLSNLARARQALGKTDEARQCFDEAIAMLQRLTPEGSPLFARLLWRSGTARFENSDVTAAIPELQAAVAMAEKHLPPEHTELKEYRETLARCTAAR
jgi:tetratricopeptide (TPR) repeat protein